jgi:alkylation response protein AidB-like acyl-CoA dehydrogenase
MDALAMTEPEAGSDVRGMSCAAVRDGGDWVVNGTKHFISGADHADFFIVFVATGVDDTPKGPKKRITCFLVDRGHPGFTIRDGYQSVSHRGYKNCILEFDDCRLPDAQVLGEVDGGFEVMNTWLYATRLTVAANSVGRARRCFDHAVAYAAERKQFGQPIAKFQGVSFQVADMITEIDAADWLTLSAAWRLDQGLPANREIASAKLYATEMLARVTDTTLQIFGGMGLMSDFPSNGSGAMRGWNGSGTARRKSSATSSAATCFGRWGPDVCSRCRAFCGPGPSPSSVAERGAVQCHRGLPQNRVPGAGLAGASDEAGGGGRARLRLGRCVARGP